MNIYPFSLRQQCYSSLVSQHCTCTSIRWVPASDEGGGLGDCQRIPGNSERRTVRPASSCASDKKDDSRTTVVNDSNCEVPDDISQDYDEDDGSPSQGQEVTIFSIPYQTKIFVYFLRNFSAFICYIHWANNSPLNL